ncbi:MAG: alpha/beta hydrolase [Gaiellaceae bacterium]
MTAGIDALVHRIRPAGGEPVGALVLLHGRGTDELDLLPLADRLDPERRLAVVTPRGPLYLPPGGYHWYIVQRVGFPDERTFFRSFGRLAEWLDALPDALGVPWERTFLGGFSMGAVMSYALGLGTGRPAPAGIVALSGFLPTVEGFELDLRRRHDLPVAIGHGTEDPIIPVDFAREARRRLEEAGLMVLYREAAMPHTIEPRFRAVLRDWLKDRLAEPRSREP